MCPVQREGAKATHYGRRGAISTHGSSPGEAEILPEILENRDDPAVALPNHVEPTIWFLQNPNRRPMRLSHRAAPQADGGPSGLRKHTPSVAFGPVIR